MSLIQIAKEGPVTILTLDRAESMNPLGAPGDGDEFVRVANAINRDMECRVVILTGAGRAFSAGGDVKAMRDKTGTFGGTTPAISDGYRDNIHLMLRALYGLRVPVIAAVNGPATVHAELALLCDIVLCSDNASFQDSAHFHGGLVPGDGVHVVFPLLLGTNRGRYFLLTGQTLSANEAKDLGLVNEVLPRAQLLDRAWTHARMLMQRPPLLRRYARVLLTQDLKKRMQELLGYGLALEGLAATQRG